MSTAAAADDSAKTRQVFTYFTALTLFVYVVLPNGYLVDFATTFMLKDRLHASAGEVALFRVLTGVPVYLAFVFGLTRDLWNPLGLRDRGFFLIFAPVTALAFFWMAFTELSYWGLFTGMMLTMLTFRFVAAAMWGLTALTGQEQLMSGRLSALWNIVSSIPYIIGATASGWVAEYLPPRTTFILCACLALVIGLLGLWKPKAVFDHAYDKPQARSSDFAGDIKRLFRHRAIYPAVLIIFLFQFAPGANTPLQFYLTDHLHASDMIYGYYYAIFAVSFIPMFFIYAWLCKRVPLNRLLFWGIVITTPQMMPLAFIHSATAAMVLALPIGLMGGIAAGAIYDLGMRSCPPGLQGTLMMLIEGANQLSTRGSDLLGAKIYGLSADNGFLYCAIATTVVYALMLPVMLLIPRELIATADGEANPVVEAETLREIAETA
jgi:MFS family permease